MTQSPCQSAPTILKNRAPCFLKNGAPCFLKKAGWKKQGHSLFKKRRDQAASSLFELQWPWFFALCFFSKSRVPDFQKAGCPIFKNSGCRLTGRQCQNALWSRFFFEIRGWRPRVSEIFTITSFEVSYIRSIVIQIVSKWDLETYREI